jgi:hypothetical protein
MTSGLFVPSNAPPMVAIARRSVCTAANGGASLQTMTVVIGTAP